MPILLLSFSLSACSTFLFWERPSYIRVEGTHFVYESKPFYFTGTNMWDGCYLGSTGNTGDRARLVRELDDLRSRGITNLRVLGASEESYIQNSLKPAIQLKPGVYDENLLDGLDFLLSELDKRQMHAVIFLNNYWEWSGGMAQYVDWANGGGGVDPGKGNYGAFMDYSASFYANGKADSLFFNYVKDIVTRRNHYDGFTYTEEPAIMGWELANEPRPGRDERYISQYYRWIDSTAHFIHTLDPNHLVTTGSEGLVGNLQDSTIFVTCNRSKYIDYLTFHLWPKNWGWFDAKNIGATYAKTEANAVAYIDKHIELARVLGKPIVMEEFGLPRDSEFYAPGTPTTARDRYYSKILTLIYDSAAAGAPIAGTNVWGWGGEGRAMHPDFVWRPGDPFTGDPPQEPQGLNSIFDVDTTTLTILNRNALEMIALRDSENLITTGKLEEIKR